MRCAPAAIVLSEARGQPLRMRGHERVGLSVSHERGVSLLALCVAGPVGVDLVAIDRAADHGELRRTAALFLPPREAAALDELGAREHQAVAFFHAWACHEARLKCIGQPLMEWSPAWQTRLADLRTAAVELPDGAGVNYAAAIAWRVGELAD